MPTLLRIGLENAIAASFLAVLAACAGGWLKRRPAMRHCLWLLVLVKLVTPPIWSVSIDWETKPAGSIVMIEQADESTEEDALAEPLDVDITDFDEGMQVDESIEPQPVPVWSTIQAWSLEHAGTLIASVWSIGSLLTLLVLGRKIHRFRKALALAKPASERVVIQVEDLSAKLGLGWIPEVLAIEGEVSPLVWAIGRSPVIVLPNDLWKQLDRNQTDALLTHELAHIARRDHWVRYLELVVTVLFWWLPVVWWAQRALRDAEEECCDAWVVWALPGSSRAYAETLIETVEFLSRGSSLSPVAASGFGHAQHLKRRLIMIMSRTSSRTLGHGGLLAAIGLAVGLLPLSLSFGQEAKQDQDVQVRVLRQDFVVDEEVNQKVQEALKDLPKLLKQLEGLGVTVRDLRVAVEDDKGLGTRDALSQKLKGLRDVLTQLQSQEVELAVQVDQVRQTKPQLDMIDAKAIEAEISKTFERDPEVQELRKQLETFKRKQEQIERIAVDRNDPSVKVLADKVKETSDRLARKLAEHNSETQVKIETLTKETLERLKGQFAVEADLGKRLEAIRFTKAKIEDAVADPKTSGKPARVTITQSPDGKGTMTVTTDDGKFLKKQEIRGRDVEVLGIPNPKPTPKPTTSRVYVLRSDDEKKDAESQDDDAKARFEKATDELKELKQKADAALKEMQKANDRLRDAETQLRKAETLSRFRESKVRAERATKAQEPRRRVEVRLEKKQETDKPRETLEKPNPEPKPSLEPKPRAETRAKIMVRPDVRILKDGKPMQPIVRDLAKPEPDTTQEKRIADLEKKLDKILSELDSIKKAPKQD